MSRIARSAGPPLIVLLCAWSVVSAAAAQVAPPASPPDAPGDAWLGVLLSDAVDGGVQILAVVDDGPAEAAGMQAGDVLVQAGGRAVGNQSDLGRVLRDLAPGQSLETRVLRGTEEITLTVLLGRREESEPKWRVGRLDLPAPPAPVAPFPRSGVVPEGPATWSVSAAGFKVTEITPALRVHFGAPEDAGVLVTKVEADHAAARAGLQVGDVLVRIADRPIRSGEEVRVNLVRWDERRPIPVQVIRGNHVLSLTVAAGSESGSESSSPGAARTGQAQRRQMMRQQLEMQIERLQRRLKELQEELARLEGGD